MSFVMIVSPAKKMVVSDEEPRPRSAPQFLEEAGVLARELRSLGRAGAQEVWRCSERLADENWARTRTLAEDLMAEPAGLTAAVASYSGIQYTHLAAPVMDQVQLAWLARHLRIVSGLYGLVRPLDGVVPYRLEMQARLCVGGCRNLYEFWDSRIHDALATLPGVRTIVNVASKEYAQAVEPYVLPDGPQVLTCVFGVLGPGGKVRQPATEAKAARGTFVRWAAESQVEEVGDLRTFAERGYALDPGRSNESRWVFLRA